MLKQKYRRSLCKTAMQQCDVLFLLNHLLMWILQLWRSKLNPKITRGDHLRSKWQYNSNASREKHTNTMRSKSLRLIFMSCLSICYVAYKVHNQKDFEKCTKNVSVHRIQRRICLSVSIIIDSETTDQLLSSDTLFKHVYADITSNYRLRPN